jgi:hypothetical protein
MTIMQKKTQFQPFINHTRNGALTHAHTNSVSKKMPKLIHNAHASILLHTVMHTHTYTI